MIDVAKELQEFVEDLQEDSLDRFCGLADVIGEFNKVLKKLGKEQYKYSHQLDEIMMTLEEQENFHKGCVFLQQQNRMKDMEVKKLVAVLLSVLDSYEDLYRYALKYGDESWKEQMTMQWNRTDIILKQNGIVRIEGIGELFVPQLYAVEEIRQLPDIPNGQIVDVIRSGYMYNGEIIRKARVVVNQTSEEHEGRALNQSQTDNTEEGVQLYEQDNRD
ncbi:molecular chaperone GrpE (heat shock protein) [Caldicoprobacter guelmensis]|uniref:nucleotide exchange factor GrpE n=1 Tax=Caldicoprobacter guelmensis TaxID=1170224 RepID=UPI0019571108|nr:nucleotide exchange factor GrpE [Caldicoprobacter guelmensis]MBM7583193.1 molecular chaperone GrpE (heat shock protein) [Caldicoprobacter guelmensis]